MYFKIGLILLSVICLNKPVLAQRTYEPKYNFLCQVAFLDFFDHDTADIYLDNLLIAQKASLTSNEQGVTPYAFELLKCTRNLPGYSSNSYMTLCYKDNQFKNLDTKVNKNIDSAIYIKINYKNTSRLYNIKLKNGRYIDFNKQDSTIEFTQSDRPPIAE